MKKLLLLIALLLIGVAAAPSSAQSSQFSLFLAESSGHVLLYRADADGSLTPLSTITQGDVQMYKADANGAAFIATTKAGSVTLNVVDMKSKAITTAPLSADVIQLALSDSAVSIITTSADKPTVLSFDRTTLKPIANHSTALSDSVLSIQSGGKWVMAYNPKGNLDVFSLPDLQLATFALADRGYTAPSWSPSGAQLQLIASTTAKRDDHFIYVIDVGAGTTQQFPLPSSVSATQWSDHGHYIVGSSRTDAGTLIITNVADGTQKTLSEPGFLLAPLSWSFDDTWMLYSAQIGATGPSDLFAYNVATGEQDAVHALNSTPLSEFWASDSDQLLIIAQASDQSVGLFTVTAPQFDTWQPLIPSANGPVVDASIAWTGNTVLVEYAGAMLSMDLGTRAALRLTPISVQVVPGSEQLIG